MDNKVIDFSQKWNDDVFSVEYSIEPSIDLHSGIDRSNIEEKINSIKDEQSRLYDRIDELNVDIERLTNHADGFDYAVAASSGIICGLVDSFFVSDFNFEELKTDAHKHVNKFIEKYAKLSGWDGTGTRGSEGHLKDAIDFLEKKFPVAQDNVWKSAKDKIGNALRSSFSSTHLHHLEDIAHHPTPLGLVSAVAVSFFRCSLFVDKEGKWHLRLVDTAPKEFAKIWTPIVISGILRWLVYLAESNYKEKNGKKIPAPISILVKLIANTPGIIEILKVCMNWFGHLVSDMGGSKNTPDGGKGIPGLFLSLLKEIASTPPLNNTPLPGLVSDWYSKDKFDLRAELAIAEYLGKQSVPVILNECIVRTFFFARHLVEEKRKNSDWKDMNWKNVKPWGNRTITRMISIASGTFTAFDVADAAIRSAIKNGCNYHNPKLYIDFIIRINFVGIGRFGAAIYTDAKMGHKKANERQEHLVLMSKYSMYDNAILYYSEEGLYTELIKTAESFEHLQDVANKSAIFCINKIIELDNQWEQLSNNVSSIVKTDSDFANELLDELI